MNERQILALLKTGQVVFHYPLKVHFREGGGEFGVSVPKRNFIERLLDALNIVEPAKTASSIIIALGVILICGFLMTRLTKLLRLPNATAYIVTGILIGPSVINLIPQEFISRTPLVNSLSLKRLKAVLEKYLLSRLLRLLHHLS